MWKLIYVFWFLKTSDFIGDRVRVCVYQNIKLAVSFLYK